MHTGPACQLLSGHALILAVHHRGEGCRMKMRERREKAGEGGGWGEQLVGGHAVMY